MVQSLAPSRLSGRSALGCVLGGLAQAVSIATPWDGQALWWLQIAALALLARGLDRSADWRGAALRGGLFAWAWLGGTFWWLFISMHTYGGLPAVLAVLAVAVLTGVLALYYALACGIFAALGSRHAAGRVALFAALWLLAELARNSWFTGFPWGASGYAHVDGPLAWLAPYIGVHGIAAAAAALAYALSLLGQRQYRTAWRYWLVLSGSVVALVIGQLAHGPESTSAQSLADVSRPAVSVALLQGNIAQDEKFQGNKGVPDALAWYGAQLRDASAQLVVAPETAIPLLPQQLPPDYWPSLRQRYASGETAALIGIPLGDYVSGYTNSVIGLAPGASPAYRYDKHHLVPFGEFIPPLFKWFTQMMNIPLGDFNRGTSVQPSFAWAGQRWAANICYEDLFGEELAARFADPRSAPTVMVNLSNIGWFGNSVAIDQHLNISRMRAMELARPFVRATNTGATAFIDHRGVVTQQLPRHTRGVLLGQVQGRSAITPYAGWAARFGLWPLWGLALAVVLLALAGKRRRAAL